MDWVEEPTRRAIVDHEVPIQDLPTLLDQNSKGPSHTKTDLKGGQNGGPRSTVPRRPKRASELSNLSHSERLAAAGDIHLFSREMGKSKRTGNTVPVAYYIHLATLQRMVLGQLRSDLAVLVREIYENMRAEKGVMHKSRALLAEYCDAVRDYDFMAERLKQARDYNEDDPFEISTRRVLDLCAMRDAGLVPTDDMFELLHYQFRKDHDDYARRRSILPSTSRHDRHDVTNYYLYLERLGMGLAGGTALIIPMLVMVLHKTLLTTLLTTSVATIIFAGVLALLGKGLKGETVLASVAAYAAVLVVFVGTSEQ